MPDCTACRKCRETGCCVFYDIVNEFVEKTKSADGFVFGSPVYLGIGRTYDFLTAVNQIMEQHGNIFSKTY